MMLENRYVFLGPQGSGKGTQAELLAARIRVPHISTGELFREAVDAASPLGQAIATALKAGHMISDETTNKLVTEEFIRRNLINGYILDGYPRNMVQVEHLESLAAPSSAILIDLSDEEAIKRITGRRVCTACGTIFHVEHKPPQVTGVCDSCGGRLDERADDTAEAVRARLAQYHEVTEPLLAFYEASNRLLKIDGRPSIATVADSVAAALGL